MSHLSGPHQLAERFRADALEAHLWIVPIAGLLPAATGMRILSPDENARADRFHFERDRDRYIVSHTALRHLLSIYGGVPADEIGFGHGRNGKAFLEGPSERQLAFNLSHSGEFALIGISRPEIGVDVEAIREDVEDADIAKRYFSSEERNWLDTVDPARRRDGFYRLWTVKEAFLKAAGTGLSTPLTEVSVRFGPPPRARMFRKDGIEYASRYSEEVRLADGYAAAVVLHATEAAIRVESLQSL